MPPSSFVAAGWSLPAASPTRYRPRPSFRNSACEQRTEEDRGPLSNLPQADPIPRFEAWLREAGARMPALCFRHFDDGSRRVCAKTAIRAGEAVLEIPRRCLVTSDDGTAALAAGLLEKKRQADSWWAPYVRILPVEFPHSPLSFQQPELDLLKGSSTFQLIADLRKQICANYARLTDPPDSLREFQWAWQVVASRAFSIEEAGRKMQALVPGADMLDHRLPKETTWAYDERAKVFRMTAVRDFQAGEIVHDSYGNKSNRRFFVYYGFVEPGNGADEATLFLPPPPAGHRYQGLMSEIVQPSANGVYRFTTRVNDLVSDSMLSYLRLHSLIGSESITVTRGSERTSVVAINRRNEAAALSALLEACRAALDAFDTTIAEDDALLCDPNLTLNLRNAVIVRRGEKRVLHHYRQLAETVIPLLSLPASQFARVTQSPPISTAPFRQYLDEVRRAFGC
jgi:hypothetical protein